MEEEPLVEGVAQNAEDFFRRTKMQLERLFFGFPPFSDDPTLLFEVDCPYTNELRASVLCDSLQQKFTLLHIKMVNQRTEEDGVLLVILVELYAVSIRDVRHLAQGVLPHFKQGSYIYILDSLEHDFAAPGVVQVISRAHGKETQTYEEGLEVDLMERLYSIFNARPSHIPYYAERNSSLI